MLCPFFPLPSLSPLSHPYLPLSNPSPLSPIPLPLSPIPHTPLLNTQHRVSLDTSLPVRISLFLIHSYFARLVIAIIAIAWIIGGAAINMSACDTSSVITSQVLHVRLGPGGL